jgi:hypothetical protein
MACNEGLIKLTWKEGAPETSGWYLATVKWIDGFRTTEKTYWYSSGDYWIGGVKQDSLFSSRIIAHMPLPEPWKEKAL